MERDASLDGRGSVIATSLLGLALVLGGGSPSPWPGLALQILMFIGFGWWLHREQDALTRVPSAAWWVTGLVVLLHLAQLVPLPPAAWHVLPGRSAEMEALELIRADHHWRPLSLSPTRTVASLLCALSALALMLLSSTLATSARWRLISLIAVAGGITILVGAAQIKGETGNLFRFYNPEQIWLTGFFANHNSTADLVLIALIAVAALAWRWRRFTRSPATFGAMMTLANVTLFTGLFLTGSRTGLALLPLALLGQFLILRANNGKVDFTLARWMASVAVIGALSFSTLRHQRSVAVVLDRFTLDGEFRPELWRDAAFALVQYWPIGSGQGSFVPVMIAAERLEVIDPTIPNRAHNDFLELAIEGGLPAVIALGVIGLILITTFAANWRGSSSDSRVQTLFSGSTLVVLQLHSLLDYPLRSMALAAVAASAAGMLFPSGEVRPGSPGSRKVEN